MALVVRPEIRPRMGPDRAYSKKVHRAQQMHAFREDQWVLLQEGDSPHLPSQIQSFGGDHDLVSHIGFCFHTSGSGRGKECNGDLSQ